MTKFDDLIAAFTAERHFLAVLRPYDPVSGTIVTIRLSSHGFTTAPGDDPSNTHYEARLSGMLNFTRSLFAQGRLSGRSVPGQGDIGLVNADGGLDALAGYAWGGRQVQVWMGGPGFYLSEFGMIFDGTAQGLEWGDSEIRVKTRDLQYVFDREFQPAVFAGTGAAEGGDDLKDKRKPRALGFVRAISPVYLGIDGGFHKFAVGDGPIVGVNRILDRGIALAQVGNALNPGEWSVDLATGIVKLGGSYDGPLVADVAGWRYRSEPSSSSRAIGTGSRAFAVASLTGFAVGQWVRALADASPSLNWMEGVVTAASGGTLTILVDKTAGTGTFAAWTLCPVGTVAGIAQALALAAGVPIVAGVIAALDAAQPATVGTWRPEGGKFAEVLDELVDGIGGYWGFNRTGFFDIGRLTGPGSSALTLDTTAILDIERQATQEPNHEVVVRYGRVWTVHSADQVAGAASDDDRKLLVAEWRQSKVNSAPTLTAWPLSEPITVDSPFAFQADAVAEAGRLLAIYSALRSYYKVRVKTQPLALDIGQTVTVITPRYGLAAGKALLIVDMTEDLDDNTVELGLWGLIMANIHILRTLLDDKAVSGGSWAIPLANVLTDQPRKIARSTNLLTTSTTMTFDLGRPTLLSMVALIATNLSKGSSWRIRVSLAADLSAPVIDVTQPGHQPDIVWGSLPWGAFPWDGYSGKTPPGGVISFYKHSASVIGRYLRIDITDTGNAAGYVDIGRVMAGDAFVPRVNMSFGAELGIVDDTKKTRSIGGQTWADRKAPRRRLACSFDALTQAEAMGQIYDVLVEVGIGGNLLVSYDPDDTIAVLPRRTIYGQLTELPPIVEDDPSTHPHAWRFALEEMI